MKQYDIKLGPTKNKLKILQLMSGWHLDEMGYFLVYIGYSQFSKFIAARLLNLLNETNSSQRPKNRSCFVNFLEFFKVSVFILIMKDYIQ